MDTPDARNQLEGIRADLLAHMGGEAPHDDITLPERVFNPSYERKVLPPELNVPSKY